MDFHEKYGPTAVIAGGSEGVGASYAQLLAERGLDLVLVARKQEPLVALAATLREQFPSREVVTLSADLTHPGTPDTLFALTQGREVGLLIYNAGSCTQSLDFVDNDLAFAQRLVALNATTPMALVHHYARAMKARGRGGVILVSSFAGLVGNPTLAAYSAAKAFSTTFAEALWHELGAYGVDVLSHMLGSTDTPFIARHFPQAVGHGEKPDDVAQAGLAALAHGPVLRATGGDDFARLLGGMNRADAVRAAYESGKLFSGQSTG